MVTCHGKDSYFSFFKKTTGEFFRFNNTNPSEGAKSFSIQNDLDGGPGLLYHHSISGRFLYCVHQAIDLIEWKHPRDDTPPYPHLYHLGVARIALRTTDLASDLAALRSIGAELIAEPATVAGLGSAGTRFVCFKDPDGTTLELVEVLEA